MTMHPSLRSGSGNKKHRSVLKRYERLSLLSGKEKWDEKQSVFGLQKVKTLKVKIKKEKAAEEPAVVATEATAAPATPTAPVATPVKPQAKKEEKKK